MSLATNITNLATRVATEVKSIRTLVNGNAANLSGLNTDAKNNLVAAINELVSGLDTVANDASTGITNVSNRVGSLAALSTSDVSSIVAAINSLKSELDNIDLSALISDTTTSASTTWSSSKIDSEIDAAVSALVAGAPNLLNTLDELAAALGDDANFAANLTTTLAGKAAAVHTHAISDVTGLESALNAKANAADVGDTTTNFVTTFEAGLL